jgi:hypothetical protein
MKLSLAFLKAPSARTMSPSAPTLINTKADFSSVEVEHRILIKQYGQVQQRCSALVSEQGLEVLRLQTCVMRLRAELMIRETALAFEREDRADLDAVLGAADLVICQTGCVSHDAYWRVQDHCKRTGKKCVLVDQPTAIKVMMASSGTI